jgi:Uma2 family endonuclease
MSAEKIKYLPNYSVKDYEQWEGKWELIDGIPYAMSPSPNFTHQNISSKIHIQLSEALKNCGNCKALFNLDWRLKDSENNVFCPDNFVMCKDIKDDFLTEPPGLIFEILSPATYEKDRILKYEKYEENGVKYYVIVDGNKKSAEVYELINGKYVKQIVTSNETHNFRLDDCSFDFDFSKIW